MSENVFHVAQIAPQSGTFAAVGSSVAAINILPVTEVITPELDRAATYPQEDYGRNANNHAGRGYYGLRGANFSLAGEATFEQLPFLLEMHNAGGVAPSGSNPYTWLYPLEAGAPTILPHTIETGSEASQDQYELVGCLIDELTLGYDALAAPGASPWTYQASGLAVNRVQAALTASLASTAVETMQGHLTVLKEGTTGTAFAALAALTASLIQFSITTRRSLILRPTGATSGDIVGGYGFSEKTSGEIKAMVAHGATAKTDIHDIFAAASHIMGERRWRVTATGAGTNVAHLDMRLGFFNVQRGDRDGQATYDITAQIVDDATLAAMAQWTVINTIADLTP